MQIRKQLSLNRGMPSLTTFVWKMFFDGASSSIGAGAGVVFKSPSQKTISLSYKLEFEVTNNVAKYEALVLGSRAAKEMGIREVAVFGDAELIVQQAQKVMNEFHSGLCGGHYFWKTTAHKILRAGYYWPTLFPDVCREIRACIKCQKFSGKQQLKSLPLKPVARYQIYKICRTGKKC